MPALKPPRTGASIAPGLRPVEPPAQPLTGSRIARADAYATHLAARKFHDVVADIAEAAEHRPVDQRAAEFVPVLVADLVAAHDLAAGDGRSFWMTYPAARDNRPKIARFREWLCAEVSAELPAVRGYIRRATVATC